MVRLQKRITALISDSGTGHERLHCIVRGRVQGVGFRAFAVSHAERLRLTGWVRNLADGRSVEAVAEGPRDDLTRFVQALQKGPRGSYVTECQSSWQTATGEFHHFAVSY